MLDDVVSKRKHDHAPCSGRGVSHAIKNDLRKAEEWLQCVFCEEWFHESSKEEYGIVNNDDVFTCSDC